jgi:hypothetical protein
MFGNNFRMLLEQIAFVGKVTSLEFYQSNQAIMLVTCVVGCCIQILAAMPDTLIG